MNAILFTLLFSWFGIALNETPKIDSPKTEFNESKPTETKSKETETAEAEPSDVQPGPDKRNRKSSMKDLEDVFATLRFNRFVDQIIRRNELQGLSNKLEIWAYQTGSVSIVNDLEDARIRLERANFLLEAEFRRNGSPVQSAALGYQVDFLNRAKVEIDEASFVLDMLLMIALSEK